MRSVPTYFFASTGSRFIALLLDCVAVGFINLFIVPASTNSDLLNLAVFIAYQTFFVGQYGYTPGKGLVGIRVVRTDGSAAGYGTALLRSVASLFSALAIFIGYAWALFNPKRQTWHDIVASTYVVEAKPRTP